MNLLQDKNDGLLFLFGISYCFQMILDTLDLNETDVALKFCQDILCHQDL